MYVIHITRTMCLSFHSQMLEPWVIDVCVGRKIKNTEEKKKKIIVSNVVYET